MSDGRHIMIVGGGTAGWMAANLMAVRWADRDVRISLLESPEIGIIGVGEGSTPQLKAFFDSIGVAESDWMPRCNATYKVGISFHGWSSKPGFDSYFHPFPAETDTKNYQAFVYHCYLRRQGIDVPAHPDAYFVPARLAAERRGPVPDYRFPFPVLYGYHFDSQLLGRFLRDVATRRGVRHVEAKVTAVRRNEAGDLSAVTLADGSEVEADFFIDSTGFRSLLLQETLGVPFASFADNLFNDAAVVLPTPQGDSPACQTISTAMRNGWAWDIPLTNRVGNGYVYSSSYCSADDAETELRTKLGLLDSNVEARHLKMKVGQVERHWHGNCVAVGLAQGFIEPLEATALHIVQETVEGFIRHYERGGFTDRYREDFNQSIAARFEGVRDYIVCHYRANSREDTDYWRDNARNEHLSDSLRGLLQTWLGREDLSAEVSRQQIARYYNTVSWHCLLAGYGLFPEGDYRPPRDHAETRYDIAQIEDFVARCALNFPPHAEQLGKLRETSAA